MIKQPPLLTINRRIERPSKQHLDALRGVPSAFVVDALGGRGALDGDIRLLVDGPVPDPTLVGTAMTCHCGAADNLALAAALTMVEVGDVLVAASDRFDATCVTGDILLGMAKNRGGVGFVTDGRVRDVAAIIRVGMPVYCRGTAPNSPACRGPGTVGLDITLGGATVASGDVVVADRDGVAVVPRAALPMVLDKLGEIKSLESELEAAVRNGATMPGDVEELLASDRVRYIE